MLLLRAAWRINFYTWVKLNHAIRVFWSKSHFISRLFAHNSCIEINLAWSLGYFKPDSQCLAFERIMCISSSSFLSFSIAGYLSGDRYITFVLLLFSDLFFLTRFYLAISAASRRSEVFLQSFRTIFIITSLFLLLNPKEDSKSSIASGIFSSYVNLCSFYEFTASIF